ncbi:hypothetical protein E2C01_030826 [Portunus trituberculatus]|uniref:Uncharacterized protein n=1 Tax=Portunus trituberculatus TaxID=210409 RepID=A0A5B7ESW5_PORTR|nr:hypothetical protein [Portunus trituberculatus]
MDVCRITSSPPYPLRHRLHHAMIESNKSLCLTEVEKHVDVGVGTLAEGLHDGNDVVWRPAGHEGSHDYRDGLQGLVGPTHLLAESSEYSLLWTRLLVYLGGLGKAVWLYAAVKSSAWDDKRVCLKTTVGWGAETFHAVRLAIRGQGHHRRREGHGCSGSVVSGCCGDDSGRSAGLW